METFVAPLPGQPLTDILGYTYRSTPYRSTFYEAWLAKPRDEATADPADDVAERMQELDCLVCSNHQTLRDQSSQRRARLLGVPARVLIQGL